MFSYFEKYIIKHFIYGIILGFLYTLFLKDFFVLLFNSDIDLDSGAFSGGIINFLKSMFTVAIVYSLLSIIYFINFKKNKK